MKWLEPEAIEVPAELQMVVGGHPLVAQALVRRGICTPQAALAFLDPAHYTPTSPLELPDMAVAVERLQAAIMRGERILVWGDFDVDGLTSTALLAEALLELGAQVDWYIPDRRKESHGVHWRSLQPFLGCGTRVLLTCDTGVTAHEAITLARNAGLDVLITDHHDLPTTLPKAQAIVNPKRLPAGHSLYNLSGVGVAYELAVALGVSERGLDLVALGLVADVVPQRGEVRYLLQRGLQVLRRMGRVGVQALLEVAEIDPAVLDEGDIAFSLAPRLNALGRLADARAGVELFLTQDLARARAIAAELEAWNVRRQFLSKQVTLAAQEQVQRDPALASSPAWVLAHPSWPAGVLGVAAGRLAERHYRPVVLISAPPGEPARGSARSVPGIDIRAALAAQSALLRGFGGHPMAAGFSLDAERIPELRRALIQTVSAMAGPIPSERELPIAAYFAWSELTLDLHDQLARLAPFGVDNPPLYLATRRLRIADKRAIGRTGEHLRLDVKDEAGYTQIVLWWNGADAPLPEGWFDLAYRLDDNVFQGERRLQLEWVDARWIERPAIELKAPVAAPEVADYRMVPDPLTALQALWDKDNMQLWAEGVAMPSFPGRGRHELQPSSTLVVWTAPPGPREWERALSRVQPTQVYLFALDPELDALELFLKRLAGLVKHALSAYGGRLGWEPLAAATAQRVETVQAGLRWMVARGWFTLVQETDDTVLLRSGGNRNSERESDALHVVEELLRETAAYRAHFREAETRRLVERQCPGFCQKPGL